MLLPAKRVFSSCHRSFQGVAHAIKDTTKKVTAKSGSILGFRCQLCQGLSYCRGGPRSASAIARSRKDTPPLQERLPQELSFGCSPTGFGLLRFRRNVVVNPFQNDIGDFEIVRTQYHHVGCPVEDWITQFV